MKISNKHTLHSWGKEEGRWAKDGIDILVNDEIRRRVTKRKDHTEAVWGKLNIIQIYAYIRACDLEGNYNTEVVASI